MTLFRLNPGCLITFQQYGGLKLRSFQDAIDIVSSHYIDCNVDEEARQALLEHRLLDAPVSDDYDKAVLLTALLDEEVTGNKKFLN